MYRSNYIRYINGSSAMFELTASPRRFERFERFDLAPLRVSLARTLGLPSYMILLWDVVWALS